MSNTQTSVPLYAQGEVLTAANLNLTNSGIPVFATTVTRDAAFGGANEKVLAEGQFAYIEATNTTQYYDGAAWQALTGARIGQVVSTAKTDSFSSSATAYTDITGLSVSITPTLATSKVLVLVSFQATLSGDISGNYRLVRDSTAIFIGDTAGSRTRATSYNYVNTLGGYQFGTFSPIFLDSPATTSATTYKVQGFVNTGTFYVNRGSTDADNVFNTRSAASITVMEVIV
jgi:hypothetical protein